MADQNPVSLTKRLVLGSLAILFAAWAVTAAIKLLATIWVVLLIVCILVLVVTAVVFWKRHQGW